MDPDEIESILGGDGDRLAMARLAELVRTAQRPPTASELAREDLDLAQYRRTIRQRGVRRQRVLSRFTPVKVAAAAAAFVVVGGGFTVALTHALTRPTIQVAPKQATVSPRQVKSTNTQGGSSTGLSSASKAPGRSDSGQSTSSGDAGGKGSDKGQQTKAVHGQGQQQGTTVAPGQTGAAVSASYRGLCVSYVKATSQTPVTSDGVSKTLHKLQSSTKFLRLAESALNQGLTVPQFCSQVLGSTKEHPSVSGLAPTSSAVANDGLTSKQPSLNSKDKKEGGGKSSAPVPGTNGGGIVSAGTPAKLP